MMKADADSLSAPRGGEGRGEVGAGTAVSVKLAGHSHRVIRFWNKAIIKNIDGVPHVVLRTLDEAPTSP
jgi:very-short-patch-repair endonuclease